MARWLARIGFALLAAAGSIYIGWVAGAVFTILRTPW